MNDSNFVEKMISYDTRKHFTSECCIKWQLRDFHKLFIAVKQHRDFLWKLSRLQQKCSIYYWYHFQKIISDGNVSLDMTAERICRIDPMVSWSLFGCREISALTKIGIIFSGITWHLCSIVERFILIKNERCIFRETDCVIWYRKCSNSDMLHSMTIEIVKFAERMVNCITLRWRRIVSASCISIKRFRIKLPILRNFY